MAVQKGRTSTADRSSTLAVGAAAPDFERENHLGSKTKLSDMRGKNVLLVFYPFAFTPV
jgi:mycoredoxin-dependent peroxiredoxin